MSHELTIDEALGAAQVVVHGGEGNALDRTGIEALQRLLEEVAENDAVRSVIVTGAGGTFCAGRTRNMDLYTPEEIITDLNPILELNRALEGYPLPLIAAVEGRAYGFGFGLSTLCDITVVAEDAHFALTELAHGIPPLIVLSYFFKYVPYKVAFDLSLTGREIGAEEALRLGLATSIAKPGTTLEAARGYAAHVSGADPVAIELLRSYSRRAASIANDEIATAGATRIAALLSSKMPPRP
jgi:enoyl-CoA hydratase/carnithine racemase